MFSVCWRKILLIGRIAVCLKQEPTCSARRVVNSVFSGWLNHIHHCSDKRSRREVLPCPALGVLRVLLQQAFVGIALHIGTQHRPGLGVDQIHNHAAQLGRVLKLVLRLGKDQAQRALLLAQLFERVAVVVKQVVPVTPQQRGPGIGGRYDAGLVVRRLAALVGHLEEQQIGELLYIVAIAHAVVAQHAAIVPELLDEGVGRGVHG